MINDAQGAHDRDATLTSSVLNTAGISGQAFGWDLNSRGSRPRQTGLEVCPRLVATTPRDAAMEARGAQLRCYVTRVPSLSLCVPAQMPTCSSEISPVRASSCREAGSLGPAQILHQSPVTLRQRPELCCRAAASQDFVMCHGVRLHNTTSTRACTGADA